jgi:hypothetical protein
MRQLPDLDMWVRLCSAYEIFIHPEPLLQFRLRSGNGNASADVSSNHERAIYELAKILKRYSRAPLSDQLPKIFPGSFTDFEGGAERLLDLAELAMDVQSSAHQLFGLDCLRELARNSGVNIDKHGIRLLELGLRGSPFSPPPKYLRIFHRPAGCPFTAEHCQSFGPRIEGERISMPVPPDCIQLRIDPAEQIAVVRIFHLSITDSDGVETWSIERAPERIGIFNAKILSTSERPFRMLALSNDPQIILPEIHPLAGWHLNLSLSVDSNIGAELQKLSLDADETTQRKEALRGRVFHRPAECPFTAERCQSFGPWIKGERISMPIPPDCIQLRIDPAEQIAVVRIFHLSITDSDGVETWSIERAPERMGIFNAKILSTSERPFRMLALSNDPQIILPEIHPLAGWHLNLSLSVDSNIGTELQKLSLDANETAQRNEALGGRIRALKKVVESANTWQEKPWYKRAFHRWTAQNTNDIET